MDLHCAFVPKMLPNSLLYMANSLSDMAGSASRISEFIDNVAKEHPGNNRRNIIWIIENESESNTPDSNLFWNNVLSLKSLCPLKNIMCFTFIITSAHTNTHTHTHTHIHTHIYTTYTHTHTQTAYISCLTIVMLRHLSRLMDSSASYR